ncbi:MAG: iron-containing alcohol dehydrogenase [Candidatus Tectomicrobia bacterium]|uniref:Iron-containing alcohol dehydrogenase n=1 Tax=Tectimicrobiota bacterium TaxID=2528274 RepID=A0A932HX07_UNCTE|nr:iron-containing alcohol dehydrogenase [Candidatus Tectomicrobia bacterium]
MVQPFQISRGPRVRFGRGEAVSVGEEARALGMKRPMLLTDPGLTAAGVLEPVLAGFKKAGVDCCLFEKAEPNPSDESIPRAREFYASNGCQGMVAVGGGSALDTAKAMGALISNGGNISDYYGVSKPAKRVPLFIAVPTTAGTGSEVTRASIITDTERQVKASIHSDMLYADLAVVDSSLLAKLPRPVAAGALMDALTHAIESIGSPKSSPWTEAMCMQAIGLIGKHARRFVESPADPEAADALALAATLAGASFTNTGLGIVHALTHPYFMAFGGHHGTINAILLPPVMRFNLPAMREKYARMAPLLAGEDADPRDPAAAEAAIEEVSALGRDIGIPSTFRAYCGWSEDGLEMMAREAAKSGSVQTNPVFAGEAEMRRLYQEAG